MVMEPQELRSKLHGVIAFPVTPFRPDLSLDIPGLRKNLQAIVAHPVCAIVAAGGTGEVYSLTPDEYVQVVRTAVEEAHGRVPVIAGAAFNATLGAQLAQQAARAGASGILAFPPYYPHADENGLFEYYRAIGEATPLGLFIYSRDWVHPGPAMVERLAKIRTLIAWKDGQGDLRRLQIIMERLGNRLHWIGGAGDDMVPSYYAAGIRTYTSSISNVSCRLALELHELASKGETVALGRLMTEYVVPLYAFRARRRGYEVSVMKELMMLLGLAGGPVRPPLENLRPDEIEELRATLPLWQAKL
jgi:5-dehydro-4-deoxyglucarate dehydratase